MHGGIISGGGGLIVGGSTHRLQDCRCSDCRVSQDFSTLYYEESWLKILTGRGQLHNNHFNHFCALQHSDYNYLLGLPSPNHAITT